MKRGLKFCLKIFGAISLLLALSVLAYLGFFYKDISAFRSVLSGYHSHLFCSCTYISQQTEEVCLDFARQYIDIQAFHHDPIKKEVYTKALGIEATARFVNEQEGCILDAP